MKHISHNQRGITLLETLVALVIVSTAGLAFAIGLSTLSRGTMVVQEQATAESLVRSQAEYVKQLPYQSAPTTYPVSTNITIPNGWQVPQPTAALVHATDDGIQRVTVSAQHGGRTILSIVIYKVNR